MISIWSIRRSATDTKVAGLCGGVAQHWGVDPVLVRVGCALLALSGGVGLVLYVAGWLLIPVQGRDRAPVDDFFGSTGRRWPKEVWIALVVVACLAGLALFGSVSPFGIAPAVVLAVIWYFGFYRGRARTAQSSPPPSPPPTLPAPTLTESGLRPVEPIGFAPSDLPPPGFPPPGPPPPGYPAASYPTPSYPTPSPAPAFVNYPGPATPFTEAADAWRQRIEQAQAPDPEQVRREAFLAHADPVGLYTEPAPAVATPVRRSRSSSARRLRLVCLVVLGLALGTLGILDRQGLSVSLADYLGAALLVVGLSLVAATWFGRPAGLVLAGVLLVAALAASAVLGPMERLDHWTAVERTYGQVVELPAGGDIRDVGELTVDLRGLELTKDAAYQAHVGTGSLEVTVPADVNVVVRYTVDVGVVQAYDAEASGGTDLHSTVSRPTTADPDRPTLTLDLSVDQGSLAVRQ